MQIQTTASSYPVPVLALLLASCGSNGDQPTAQEYDDVAKSVASMVVLGGAGGEVASMEYAIALVTGAVPVDFTATASGEVQGTHLGFEYAYAFTCEDEAGNALDPCDDTTDAAHVMVSWSGELTIPSSLSASVARAGEWSLTGLQSDVATFDGDGTFELESAIQSSSGSRSYMFRCASTYDQIMIEDGSPPTVTSGVIRYDIDAARTATTDAGHDVASSFHVTAEVTFEDGDATIVLDGERSYHLNTATGEVTYMTSGTASIP